MITAEHCMYLKKFCDLLACHCMCYSFGELKFMLGAYMSVNILTVTSQIYKNWSLHDLNSTRSRTGAGVTQNQKDWRSLKLNHEHSHSR